MAKPKKLKTAAQVVVAQSKDEAASMIRQLGDLQRSLQRDQAKMNDLIAEITDEYKSKLGPLQEQIEQLQKGVQAYCEAHRDELTSGGKVKFANLVTGNVLWRQRPPSVRITGAESVIDTLKRLGLGKFVRAKEEVNKEAILNEPKAVSGVAGITIVSGVEDFVIEPFEQELDAA